MDVTLSEGDVVSTNGDEYIVGRATQLADGAFYVRLDKKFQPSIGLKIKKKGE